MADRGPVGSAGSGTEVLAGAVAGFEHPARSTHSFAQALVSQPMSKDLSPTPGAPNAGQLWPRHGYVSGS